MKRLGIAAVILAVVCAGLPSTMAQTPPTPPGSTPVAPPAAPRARTSPHETINAIVEGNYQAGKRMVIVYGRPYMKDSRSGTTRKIFGTLVPWGTIWRTGADEATLLITEADLVIGDKTVPAGAYSVYTLPVENGTSQLILNKRIGQWGLQGATSYPDSMKETEVGRYDLKTDMLTSPVEQFTMVITPKQGGGGGTIKLAWESTQFSLEFATKK